MVNAGLSLAKRQKAGKKIEIDSTLGSGDNKVETEIKKGKPRDLAIKIYGASISPPTYSRAMPIIEYGSEEVKQRLRDNKSKINTEYKLLKNEQARQKSIEENKRLPPIRLPAGTKLILGDFREKSKEIPDNRYRWSLLTLHTPENTYRYMKT